MSSGKYSDDVTRWSVNDSGVREPTTVIQRVLASGAQALESTFLRLRRLSGEGDPRPAAVDCASKDGARRSKAEAPAGRVEHDSRGSAVWNWAVETGVFALESTQRLLKRLESPELSLEDKPRKALELESDSGGGGGYDPYNQAKAATKGNRRK